MRFQISLRGRMYGLLNVNVTPIDVAIEPGERPVFREVARRIDGSPVRFGPFQGKLVAKVSA